MDERSGAPARTSTGTSTREPDRLALLEDGREVEPLRGPRTADLDGRRTRAWWRGFSEQVRSRADELTELDRLAGDGDFGHNLSAAVRGADERIRQGRPYTAGGVFEAVSLGFLDTGGTSGPLLGMWFREFARACGETAGAQDLARAAREGLDCVQRLGGAQPGDKTMVDAMEPAARALEDAAHAGVPAVSALSAAYRAAADGVRGTQASRATRGRASYVGEAARGVVDPGALVVAWFFERGTVV
ncbi:DAK2 domain-containing protein [Kineococcus sp. SYSU DK004]|uniref:DAK2 domain-containing protein n=1 Tax=Kineococcus sp. SYSU DK004 TaxID=3383125 RepID=UPI003D7EA8D9